MLLNIVNMLVGLVLAPFIVHSLGDVQNGYWVIARMIFGYYGFVDFGVGISIARFLSLAVGTRDVDGANKVIQSAFSFIIVIDCLFFAITMLLRAGIARLGLSFDVQLVQDLLLIMGFSILVILPGRVFAGILTAHVRQDIIAWIGIFNAFVRALLIFSFLSFGFGIRSLAIISGVIALLSSALYYLTARHYMQGLHLRFFSVDKLTLLSLFKYGISMSLASVSDLIRWGAAPLIAGFIYGAAFVTHFNVALSLGRYGVALIGSAFAVMMPVFGQLVGSGDDAKMQRVFFRVLNLTVLVSVFLFGGMIILGDDFISNWMGFEYRDAYPALVFMSVGLMVALMQNPVITLMQGMGLAKVYAVTNGIEALLNVVLCFVLGKYGMIGFGIAFGLPMVVIKLLIQPYVILSRTGWDVKIFYYKILSRFMACAAACGIAAVCLIYINLGVSWGAFLLKACAYILIYGTLIFVFVMKKDEKDDCSNKLLDMMPISLKK